MESLIMLTQYRYSTYPQWGLLYHTDTTFLVLAARIGPEAAVATTTPYSRAK